MTEGEGMQEASLSGACMLEASWVGLCLGHGGIHGPRWEVLCATQPTNQPIRE